MDAPAAPAGVAANHGFVSPRTSHAQALQPGRLLVAERDRAGDRTPRPQGRRLLDALDAGRRGRPPRPAPLDVLARLGRRGRLGPVPDVAPRPRPAPALRQLDRHRHDEGPRAHRPAQRGAHGRREHRARVGRDGIAAADPHARRVGRRAVPDARRQLRTREGRGRPPHGHGERVHAGPGAGRDPRRLPLPPEHERLERHRLQLPRRPLRADLGGTRRAASTRPSCGAHAQGYNSQTTGISNLGTFTSVPQTDAAIARDGAADRVEAREPRRPHRRHDQADLRRRVVGALPVRLHEALSEDHRPPRHGRHGVPGRAALLPAVRPAQARRRAAADRRRRTSWSRRCRSSSRTRPTGYTFTGALTDARRRADRGRHGRCSSGCGRTGWKRLEEATTDSDGNFAATATFKRNTVLRWEFAGDDTYRPFRGDGAAVPVAPLITLSASDDDRRARRADRLLRHDRPAEVRRVHADRRSSDDGTGPLAARRAQEGAGRSAAPSRGAGASRTRASTGCSRASPATSVNAPSTSAYLYISVEEPFFPF